MKARALLIFFLMAGMRCLFAQVPLDTIFFDDFVDNRSKWHLQSGTEESLDIVDGQLVHTRLKGRGTYNLHNIAIDVEDRDTFFYEIKIIDDSARMCGAAFKFHHTKTDRLCCYTGLGATNKGRLVLYDFSNNDNDMESYRIDQVPSLMKREMTYRISGSRNQFHVHVNGHWIKSFRRTKFDRLLRWGWVFRGIGTIRVEYMWLMAAPAA